HGGENHEPQDVRRPLESPSPGRESIHEEGSERGLERVSAGDPQRRRRRPRGGNVDEKSAEENGRPALVAEQQEGGERNPGRLPDYGDARVPVGERQPELAGRVITEEEEEILGEVAKRILPAHQASVRRR